ncbi:unnamed protein product [Lactuca saligna]|uniref:Voltage-dependent anion-selective channel protein n=3 Tax=Lactuca TaxID=4235 RepID=A0AA35YES2_LACSI|nr:unnamed protein product [Lactuca saligna]
MHDVLFCSLVSSDIDIAVTDMKEPINPPKSSTPKAFFLSLILLSLFYLIFLSLQSKHPNSSHRTITINGLKIRPEYTSYDIHIHHQLHKTTNPKLRKIWTSRDWDRKIQVFTQFFLQLKQEKLLANSSKALCVGARVGQEVEALKRVGVNDSIGLDLVPYPPIVIKGDFHHQPFDDKTFDFDFSNVFDHALFQINSLERLNGHRNLVESVCHQNRRRLASTGHGGGLVVIGSVCHQNRRKTRGLVEEGNNFGCFWVFLHYDFDQSQVTKGPFLSLVTRRHPLPSLSLSPLSPSIFSAPTMNNGPGLFSDIGKKAKDLLTRDYLSDQKFSVSTTSVTGVGLTSTATKKGGLSSGDVGAIYKYKNTLIDVKFDTQSNIATTLTFTELVPSTKTIASFKLPDFTSGKLEVQYFHYHATLTSAVALTQAPNVDLSATIGTPTFAIGAEAGYETSSSKLTKYTAGITVNKPDSSASIVLGDKGDTIRASYIHHFDASKKNAAVGEITRRFSTNENTFTVGGSYAVDGLTMVKAKLNNHGKLGALLQHEIIPKSLVTISSELDTNSLDKTPKFGLALALKP